MIMNAWANLAGQRRSIIPRYLPKWDAALFIVPPNDSSCRPFLAMKLFFNSFLFLHKKAEHCNYLAAGSVVESWNAICELRQHNNCKWLSRQQCLWLSMPTTITQSCTGFHSGIKLLPNKKSDRNYSRYLSVYCLVPTEALFFVFA